MPVTRFAGSEEERVSGAIASAQPELLNAMKTNRAIADVIVTELNARYKGVDLGSKLGDSKAIHVSFSWG
jgi:hypothetical protein